MFAMLASEGGSFTIRKSITKRRRKKRAVTRVLAATTPKVATTQKIHAIYLVALPHVRARKARGMRPNKLQEKHPSKSWTIPHLKLSWEMLKGSSSTKPKDIILTLMNKIRRNHLGDLRSPSSKAMKALEDMPILLKLKNHKKKKGEREGIHI